MFIMRVTDATSADFNFLDQPLCVASTDLVVAISLLLQLTDSG